MTAYTFMTAIILTILVLLIALVIYAQWGIVKNEENNSEYLFLDYEDIERKEWTMNISTFINRYNQSIYFVQVSRNEIQMTFESESYRISTEHNSNKDEIITMIDPPGGPMVFVGMNLGFIDTVWQDCIVTEIKREDRIILIKYQKKEKND